MRPFLGAGISMLGETLKRWIVDARTISSLTPDGADLLAGSPRFLGYIPQRFKEYGQTMAQEPAKYLRQIKRRVYEHVAAALRSIDPALAPDGTTDPIVGKVKDFASLVQLSQREGVPLWKCSSTYEDQKSVAKKAFRDIAQHIIKTTSPLHEPEALRRRM